jgi:anti-anti-sigma regulatory factor
MRATPASKTLTIREIESAAWLITCEVDTLSIEATEHIQDACLEVLDRGALAVAVHLSEVEAVPSYAVDMLAVVSEILAARGGRFWLVWPHSDLGPGFHVLSFDPGRKRELERILGETDRRSSSSYSQAKGGN